MTDRYKDSIQGARECVERNKDGGVYLPDLLVVIDSQQAEIERLNNNISAMARTLSNSAKETRAEAIKEFWSRLQGIAYQSGDWSHGEHPMVVELDDAEEIYEEMVGDDS